MEAEAEEPNEQAEEPNENSKEPNECSNEPSESVEEPYYEEQAYEEESDENVGERKTEEFEEFFSASFHQNRTCRTKSYREEIGRQRNAWIRGRWKWKTR